MNCLCRAITTDMPGTLDCSMNCRAISSIVANCFSVGAGSTIASAPNTNLGQNSEGIAPAAAANVIYFKKVRRVIVFIGLFLGI